MASSEKLGGQSPGGNPIVGLLLLGGVIGVAYFHKVEPELLHFWSTHHIQLTSLGVLGLLAVASYYLSQFWNKWVDNAYDKSITAPDDNAILLGKDEHDRMVHLKNDFRKSHTQILGTTSAGKSESVILPWAIQDIEMDSGLLIIDGKSDSSFLNKLYAYVERSGRVSDFRLFSLSNIEGSSTFNPLAQGAAREVAERVFSSFKFENEYYRNVQYKVFLSLLSLVLGAGKIPTFALIHRLLVDVDVLKKWVELCKDDALKNELELYLKLPEKDRYERISGLDAALSHFSTGEAAVLFNTEKPLIDIDSALRRNRIIYFQLPTMYLPVLAASTGKMVLQCLQSAVSKRHLGLATKSGLFSCYLDDFQDYLYEGFGSLLNKSRSAGIGVVFSHQSIGDLDKVSPAFRDVVLSCTNIKIIMRSNNPETCEYFAQSFGTKSGEKVTERQKKNLFYKERTGEQSVRDVEEYIYHPNVFKQLGIGQGIVSIPHPKGVKLLRLKFQRKPDLDKPDIPAVPKTIYKLDQAILPPEKDGALTYRVG